MAQTFDDFMQELEEETRRAGPAAVARGEALKAQYGLAAELILLRKRRRLTQRQLSARTGIQQSEISRIEGGRANPTAATLAALARALGGELRILPARAKKGPSVHVSRSRTTRARNAARHLVPRAARRSRA
jgi:transcriptional regulator with XRE-family HTH domain